MAADLPDRATSRDGELCAKSKSIEGIGAPRQLEILRRHEARMLIKGKSMVSEEMHLNHFMAEHGIEPIDMAVVNLYPFEATVARPDCSLEDAVENIDIDFDFRELVRSAAERRAKRRPKAEKARARDADG